MKRKRYYSRSLNIIWVIRIGQASSLGPALCNIPVSLSPKHNKKIIEKKSTKKSINPSLKIGPLRIVLSILLCSLL